MKPTITVDIFTHHVQVSIQEHPGQFIYHNDQFTLMATIPITRFGSVVNQDKVGIVAVQLIKTLLGDTDTPEVIDWRVTISDKRPKV